MASWSEVEQFIEKKYSAEKKGDDFWASVFPLGDNRTQFVGFRKNIDEDKGDIWLDIQSPIGQLPKEKIDVALGLLANLKCGGLIKIGDVYIVRHGIPIADLSIDEIEKPLVTICFIADYLEKELIGDDNF